MKQRVSVIILNYNGVNFLRKCIPTIKNQTYKNIEILIADNGSTDGSCTYIKKFKDIIYINNGENFGYAKANNIAAKKATGDILLFLNNDTELFPDMIKNMNACYRAKTIVAPCQIPTWNKKSKGFAGGGMDIFGYPYTLDDGKTKVFYVDGAAFCIGKKDFIKLGMFDEELFIFQEDMDLSWRAQLAGYKIVPCWKSKLYHFGGGTVKGGTAGEEKSKKYESSYFRRYLNEKNVIRNLIKNYSFPLLLVLFPILFLLHAIEVLILSLLFQFKAARCYVKAYWWNLKHLSDTLTMRKSIQKMRKVSDLQMLRIIYFRYSKLTAFINLGLPKFS